MDTAAISELDSAQYLIEYLRCRGCGKRVSTGYIPIPTDTAHKGLIIRAYIECPECITERTGKFILQEKDPEAGLRAFVKARGGHCGTGAIVQQIREALLVTGGEQKRVADLLGMSPRMVSYYVRKYELKPSPRKRYDASPASSACRGAGD